MHRISRAPVLSATRRRVSGWITGPYRLLSSTSVSRQRLVRLMGRHSMTRTRSPSFASLRSSCACSVVDSRIIFLYMRCRRAVSIRTTIVLSALAEVTTPWRTFGRPGPCSFGAAGGAGVALRSARFPFCFARQARRALALRARRSARSWARLSMVSWSGIYALPPQLALDVDSTQARHGERAGEVPLRSAKRGGVLELTGGVLEAQVEQLLTRVRHRLDELVVGQVVRLAGLHWSRPSSIAEVAPSRRTNLVFTGSLWPASRMASRASGSGTPASSNITRPGLTTATQPSGEPLPEPIRVSAGFCVMGLSGKMLIQTLPPRLILRVIAIRAASIWRLVTQPRSSAFRPYSPNSTWVPPFAKPGMRPRCCLRCFTRFGESTYRPPRGPPPRPPWPGPPGPRPPPPPPPPGPPPRPPRRPR